MKKLIKIEAGSRIPDGAKFVCTEQEPDHDKAYIKTTQGRGLLGLLGITVTDWKVTPVRTVYVYEIED